MTPDEIPEISQPNFFYSEFLAAVYFTVNLTRYNYSTSTYKTLNIKCDQQTYSSQKLIVTWIPVI